MPHVESLVDHMLGQVLEHFNEGIRVALADELEGEMIECLLPLGLGSLLHTKNKFCEIKLNKNYSKN